MNAPILHTAPRPSWQELREEKRRARKSAGLPTIQRKPRQQALIKLARRGFCLYCGDAMHGKKGPKRPTRDHIIPKSRGGQLSDINRAMVCYECNVMKSNRTLVEFFIWLAGHKEEKYQRRAEVLKKLMNERDAVGLPVV